MKCRGAARRSVSVASKMTRSTAAPILLMFALLTPPAFAQSDVLLVGDSWARLFYTTGTLDAAFAAHGEGAVVVYGDATTEDGTTAADWATAPRLAEIAAELEARPSVDTVVLVLGGNDFLEGMSGGGWYVGISEEDETALFDQIESDLGVVIDAILAHDPALRVVWSSYDYPNFVESLEAPFASLVCAPLWDDLGQPTPFEINSVGTLLDQRVAALAQTRSRLSVVQNWGLMQYRIGYPSLDIAPGELPLPGDLDLPSAPEAMRIVLSVAIDCFHLSAAGYGHLSERLWQQRLEWRYQGRFLDGFESGDLVAWTSRVGG